MKKLISLTILLVFMLLFVACSSEKPVQISELHQTKEYEKNLVNYPTLFVSFGIENDCRVLDVNHDLSQEELEERTRKYSKGEGTLSQYEIYKSDDPTPIFEMNITEQFIENEEQEMLLGWNSTVSKIESWSKDPEARHRRYVVIEKGENEWCEYIFYKDSQLENDEFTYTYECKMKATHGELSGKDAEPSEMRVTAFSRVSEKYAQEYFKALKFHFE